MCKKVKNKRRTMACLPRKSSHSDSEDKDEEVFEVNDNTKSNFVTPKVFKNLDKLSESFTRFFSMMEISFKNTTRDENETAVIRQKVQEISDDIQKINDLVDGLGRKTANVSALLLAKNNTDKHLASV